MNGLEAKTAYVTGGGSGIGRATALRLASEGARVAVVDLRKDAAEAVASEIEAAGGKAAAIECDVTSAVSVERSFKEVADRLRSPRFHSQLCGHCPRGRRCGRLFRRCLG